MNVLDLGAAPGSWTQVVSKLVDINISNIVAVDILPIKNIEGVKLIQEDFTLTDTRNKILTYFGSQKIDLLISDMAANTIGHKKTDHLRTIALCEYATDFAIEHLQQNGNFVTKIFHGSLENTLLNKIKSNFYYVKHFKPQSSRKESMEIYLIALQRK